MTVNDIGVQLRRRFRREDLAEPTADDIAKETRVLESRLRWGPLIHLPAEGDGEANEIDRAGEVFARA